MRLRNGEHGYGVVTKSLHWLTVGLIGAQFAVGYRMEPEGEPPDVECDPPGEERSGGDTSDAEEERLDRLEERCEAEHERVEAAAEDALGTAWSDLGSGDLFAGGLSLPEAHVLLGLAILGVAVLRVAWRTSTPLPPWDPRLTPRDRKVVHATEVVLLTLLFVIPLSGLLLVVGAEDLVMLHVAAHVGFFLTLGAHVTMVVVRRLVPRML